MTIYRKVQAVERVFVSLEREVATFQDATGMKCLSGCGLCCKKPDIAATTLEFLPLAYHLYRTGKAYDWFEALQSEANNTICTVFKPLTAAGESGFCGIYRHRGLICRLFGFSAMLDKQGQPQLVTCRTIKTGYPEAYEQALEHVVNHHPVPIMRNFYFQLKAIDPDLGRTLMPINKAILEAVKVVLGYYAYRQQRRA